MSRYQIYVSCDFTIRRKLVVKSGHRIRFKHSPAPLLVFCLLELFWKVRLLELAARIEK